MDQVLFIFAHQDDEMAAASRIVYERERGASVHCAFLTDGGAAAHVRDRESLRALTELGVDASRIHFIGSAVPIADGSLIEHLETALEQLERIMSGLPVTRVYCLAWEGGHHDHDASHLVAVAFAARRDMLERCFELPLYRAATLLPGFRVLSPHRSGAPWKTRRLGLREGIRLVRLVRHYRSQRLTWLGLFPELFLKLVVLRREVWRPAALDRCSSRPHRGRLLYETRFGCSWDRFDAAAAPFIRANFPSPRHAAALR